MKRKRGAPPGNLNAFKHGFYSTRFSPDELRNLEELASPDLVDEISLVRVAVARFLASLQEDDSPRDIQTELAILRTINLGALSINGLVRTRLMLAGAGPSLRQAINSLSTASSRTQESQGPPPSAQSTD